MSIKIESQEELKILQDVENGKYESVDAKEFAEIEDSLKKAVVYLYQVETLPLKIEKHFNLK